MAKLPSAKPHVLMPVLNIPYCGENKNTSEKLQNNYSIGSSVLRYLPIEPFSPKHTANAVERLGGMFFLIGIKIGGQIIFDALTFTRRNRYFSKFAPGTKLEVSVKLQNQ